MALKQPRSLSDLASFAVGTIIGEQALFITKKINSEIRSSAEKTDLELNIKKLAEFYDVTLPQNLHNVVTYHTLKHIANKNFDNTQYDLNIFDLVLRYHVTKFSFEDWPSAMHYMLYMNLPKLKYLKFLYLDLKHMKNENLNYILKGIEGMKHLETFRCNYCNDDIVRVLCDNCPLINLRLWCLGCCDKHVLIQSVIKLQNLKTLNIRIMSISKEQQKQLLLGLPCLKTFESYELQSILPEIGDKDVMSLQNISYRCSNQSHVTNLTKFCPFIRKLEIDVGYDKSLDLSNLAKLKYITCLRVRCDFYKSNVLTILHTRGHQLTELGIYCNVISINTLHSIDISCPNLIKLALDCVSFMGEKAEFPTNNGTAFQKLESFSNCISTRLNDLTPCLIFFLRNCMQIKEVEFITASNLSDVDIDDILTRNPMANLRKLFIGVHKLTVKSVYKLLTSCKQLQWLGYTSNWNTVSTAEVAELHNYVRKNNVSVEFVDDYMFSLYLPSVMLEKGPRWSYCSRIYAYHQ